jgi:hypothetical protein
MARRGCCRAGPAGVQVRLATPTTSEQYVADKLWRFATLAQCPWHPTGGCGFCRHGTYERVRPAGTLIARWYCPRARRTVSALPDCLASHYSGTLADLEAMVLAVEQAPSRAAAAGQLRTEIEMPGALRYLDRLSRAVHSALATIRGLEPVRFAAVALIHARPFQPAAKGKIERFFRTCRAQLIAELNDKDTASLTALNRRLAVWIEGEYHQQPHRGLDQQTPLERWAQTAEGLRYPDPGMDLDDLFLFEDQRKVQNDRTVSLHGRVYEVDASLVGQRVTLRYDPSQPEASVQVIHNGQYLEQARALDLYANCFVKRHRRTGALDPDQSLEPTPSGLSMSALTPDDEEPSQGGTH